MRAQKTRRVSASLDRARQRFEHWRRTKRGRSRIPDGLWTLAVKAAAQCGPFRTAQVLRLDYAKLKQRIEGAARRPVPAAAAGRKSGVRDLRKTGIRDLRMGTQQAVRGTSSGGGWEVRPQVAFVEWTPPGTAVSAECLVEWEDPRGAKMRVYLKGAGIPDLAVLSRSFWGTAGEDGFSVPRPCRRSDGSVAR